MSDDPQNALPRAVAMSWGVAARPQRGPKREMSVERIVDSAIEIADTDGIGAVSMSAVASSLGYTTMSLYRYVTSKDELLVLMVDVASAISIPAEDSETFDWRSGMRGIVPLISAAVITAATPGMARQAAVSMERMRPWATGLRRMTAASMPARDMSAT